MRSDSACGIPAGEQLVPLRPIGARWEHIGEYVAPAARSIGPGIRDGHRRLCFAHSPRGAVFAAYSYFASAGTYPDDVGLLRELTAAGEVRDAVLRRGGEPRSDPNTHAELVGFRVRDYSPHAATVLLGARVAPKPSAEMDLAQTGSQLASMTLRIFCSNCSYVAGPYCASRSWPARS